ncbi:MAG: recombination protein O N-terminal domain-containing protein [Candidatus Pacebacteria bacterium]|jgi:recombinational DNA repair protein (RecF pathway)|nr:recombination protein O N-terminal domain-containing protein [Candidatus Paceibacterota bacterium]
MAYTVHTTEGFILSSAPIGEANRIYHIFTREFGMIIATAQGVRLNKSKLRPHLLDYSFSSVSLVRGKEFWRITSASSTNKNTNKIYIQILTIIKRLLQGEGEHEVLFDYLKQELFKENLDETDIMIKILTDLGYVSVNETKGADKTKLVSLINKGLKESQL